MNVNPLFVSPSVFTTAVITMPKKRRSRGKGEPITFRPPTEEESKIEAAEQLTGKSAAELAQLCMTRNLDAVVAAILEERDLMRQRYAQQFSIPSSAPLPRKAKGDPSAKPR